MQRLLSLLVIWSIIFGSTPALSLTVNGQLKGAILEKSSSDLSNWEGRVYWNTTDKQAKVYNGTDWTTLGSGSGGDGLDNQIENARAEEPVVPTSFKVYDDGAVDAPVDCTGGTPTAIQAWTRSTSSPIQGDASWLLQKDDAEDAQGQGWAIEFTVPADHPMASSYYAAFNFDFKFSDSDGPGVRIYVYDVTNSTLITPSFVSGGGGDNPVLTPVTSSTSRAQLGFQTTNGTSYRICVHNADTDTDGYSLKVDGLLATTEGGVQVGPNQGPEQAYSLTIGGTGSAPTLGSHTAEAAWNRDGEHMIVRYDLRQTSAGTAGSGQYFFPIPSGYTIDVGSIQAGALGNGGVGTCEVWDGTKVYTGLSHIHSSTAIFCVVGNETTSPQALGSTSISFANAAMRVSIRARVKINEFVGGTAVGENHWEAACSTNGTWDANASTSNTVYGLAGCPITGALTAVRTKQLQWQSPQKDDELVHVYLKYNGAWTLANQIYPFQIQNTAQYGVQSFPTSTSVYRVDFAQYVYSSGSTYGSAGAAWTSAATAWVAIKSKPGTLVPFAMATSERPGLVSRQESGSFSISVSGARSTTATVKYSLVAGTATLDIPEIRGTCSSASVLNWNIPSTHSFLYPAQDAYTPIFVSDASADQATPGYLRLNASGSNIFGKALTGGNFSSSGTCGPYASRVSYTVN